MADAAPCGRAARFAARLRGEFVPGFADLAMPPAWQSCRGEERDRMIMVMALLGSRKAIDAQLHGPSLARLAASVGEDAFDRICDSDITEIALPEVPGSMPKPTELRGRGEVLLNAATRSAELAALAVLAHDISTSSRAREDAA